MEQNQQLPVLNIATNCGECIFYNGDETCNFDNRYQLFKMSGHAKDHMINGRLCLACRNNDWRQNHIEKEYFELYKLVRDSLIPRFSIIVNCNSHINTLLDFIGQIDEQQIAPHKVVFLVFPDSEVDGPELIYKLNELELDFDWSVRILEPDIDIFEAMDILVKHDKSHYFGLINSSEKIPYNFVSIVDDLLNNQLKIFSAILPTESKDYFIISREIYMMWGGSLPTQEGVKGKNIIAKISEDAQCKKFSLTADQVFS